MLSLYFYSFIRLGFVHWFLYFLHFAFKIFDHAYYSYSKLFLGGFPISSSFLWTSVFIVCSFIRVAFICIIIIIIVIISLLTVFDDSFSQASRLIFFFLLVSALLWLQQWFVYGWFPIGWNLWWVFVCLFFLCWPRLSKVVILSADDCVFIFYLFVFWMMYPTEGASGGWVMPSVVFKGFLSVSSHYLILPRVSSLVV